MAHITALLIALTLAGQPVANALCNNWCDSPSDRHRCDEAIVNPAAPALSGVPTTCVTPTATAFLREEGQSAFHAVTPAALYDAAAVPCRAVRYPRLREGHPNAGRPLVVLRL